MSTFYPCCTSGCNEDTYSQNREPTFYLVVVCEMNFLHGSAAASRTPLAQRCKKNFQEEANVPKIYPKPVLEHPEVSQLIQTTPGHISLTPISSSSSKLCPICWAPLASAPGVRLHFTASSGQQLYLNLPTQLGSWCLVNNR